MEILSQPMEYLAIFFDLVLHIDVYLFALVEEYGTLIYLMLFLVIFCETGLVITPFLPGDSLLFASGALAGAGLLSYKLLFIIILIPAVLGDQVNYSIGKFIGNKIFEKDYRLIKRKHILAAHDFYVKHGGKSIILARFIPIIRTFAPFVAGVAKMHRKRFIFFNFIGALIWVSSLLSLGYALGNHPWIKNNFSLVIYLIVFISICPIIISGINSYLNRLKATKN